MAARQPTGGYPKIANVIGADLGALAQARPGIVLEFESVSWKNGSPRAARGCARSRLASRWSRFLRGEFSAEFLLG